MLEGERRGERLKLKSAEKLKNFKVLNHKLKALTHNKKRDPKIFNGLEKMKNKKTLKHLNKNQSFHRFHDMSI